MHLLVQALADWLGFVLMAGVPLGLSCWVSDGFAGMFTERGGPTTEVVPWANPETHQPNTMLRSKQNGTPLSYS